MTVSVGGLASGLDTQSIITQLMQLAKQPVTLLQNREQAFQVKLSAYGSVKSALSDFQSAVDNLSGVGSFAATTSTSSNENIMTVSSSGTAALGSHSVVVSALAKAQSVRSAAFTASTDVVGTGTLSIQVGTGTAVDVTIDSSNDTLAGIATAINSANAGVTAGVLDDGNGNFYLTMSSKTAGTANTISVTITNGGSGQLSSLYDTGAFVTTQQAANSQLTVDGISVQRSSNTIGDLISGVTLTLKKPDSTETVGVDISQDNETLKGKITAFVDAYNKLTDELSKEQAYGGQNGTSGPLIGDSTLRSITQGLENLLGGQVSGGQAGYDTLYSVGISLDRYGKLQVDDSKLTDTLTNHFSDVKTIFSAATGTSQGIATSVSDYLKTVLDPVSGMITTKESSLQSTITDLQDQQTRMQTRIDKQQEILQNQFNALEQLISSYQATGNYLTQQIDSLSNLNSQIASGK
jgi:flagellar hook-associated protein 2